MQQNTKLISNEVQEKEFIYLLHKKPIYKTIQLQEWKLLITENSQDNGLLNFKWSSRKRVHLFITQKAHLQDDSITRMEATHYRE